ncbi:RIKEN cDNA 4930479M11 [Mus musculus]|uniref:Transmembrane protein PMIS2 n=1 Tax=Mus musculus TaxID=10090 RepID=PMIS2_MOUSE|nr:RecName: Full=Transmembrane protein PMIS2; AltName: Full=Protein missing in infertile spermatozoa 2 [Mus musculus]AAI00425.1 RIKEN cDNA 4930479M11 gene [Mus musculus]EDL23998.1 RIKEN cDNA 4930479M11 [Mus musculus]
MDTDEQGAPGRKPLDRPQTPDELKFYARNYVMLALLAMILFLPFGILAIYFSIQTNEANKCSNWEDAYRNSSRTMWFNMLAIVAFVGIIYILVLVL